MRRSSLFLYIHSGSWWHEFYRSFLCLIPILQYCINPLWCKIQRFHILYYNICINYTIPNMSIFNNLKKIRAEKDLSLERVARLVDLSLTTIVKIQNDANQNTILDTL